VLSVCLFVNGMTSTVIGGFSQNLGNIFINFIRHKGGKETRQETSTEEKRLNYSTGTARTSAKARLTSVGMRIRIRIRSRDPDRHQNVITFQWSIANLP